MRGVILFGLAGFTLIALVAFAIFLIGGTAKLTSLFYRKKKSKDTQAIEESNEGKDYSRCPSCNGWVADRLYHNCRV